MDIHRVKSGELLAFRQVGSIEVADEGVIEGYALYWNREAPLTFSGSVTESFAARSFTRALANDDMDTLLGLGHGGAALARRSTGSLDVSQDDKGLFYRAELDIENDLEARSIFSRVKRGVLNGASVGYAIPGTVFETMAREDGTEHDLVKDVSGLAEIALAARPIHESTAKARDEANARQELMERQARRRADLRLSILRARHDSYRR